MQSTITLPKVIKIGGAEYTVKFPYVFYNVTDYVGLHTVSDLTLRISNFSDNSELSNQMILETFLHEIIHGIDFYYCGGCFSEEMVRILGVALFQLLRENNLYLYSHKIPTSVKIAGYIYKIEIVDSIEDSAYSAGLLSINKNLMTLSKFYNGKECCSQYLKINLIYLITRAIIATYLNDDLFENKEKIDISVFSNGIYQVIKDNHLEELVKKWTI